MARTIMVDAAEPVVCPKCNHNFALSEGISRQAIERQAEKFRQALRLADAHRSEKLNLLYICIRSPQFAEPVRSIVEGLDDKARPRCLDRLERFSADVILRAQVAD